jgi:hypothetical protein
MTACSPATDAMWGRSTAASSMPRAITISASCARAGLITDVLRKDTHRWYGFFANPERITGEPAIDGEPLPMLDGYEDFPELAAK